MSSFTAAWLALREPVDAAARDRTLAQRFAQAIPRPARLVDLGAGGGANARALAPLIAGAQDWHLVEVDDALLVAQRDALLAWARRLGHGAHAAGDEVAVTAGGAGWRFTGLALDLAQDWTALDALTLDGVTTSAFLDLASPAWLERLAAWLAARRLPLLATLTVDGRRDWSPPAPEDASIAAAFRRHQMRDKGLGPAAGGAAPALLARGLAERGYDVTLATSDWRLDGGDSAILAALIAGEADAAAADAVPAAAAAIAAWRERRLAQAAAGCLAITVGHRDMLALAPEIWEN